MTALEKNATYDLIVLGAGSGGLSVSVFMAKLGLRILLIEQSDARIGGDCLNDGCIPSKALIHIARTIADARKATAFGFSLAGAADATKVTDYIRSRQDIIRQHENADYLRQQGLELVIGTARFHDRQSVMVNGQLYAGKKIVLATGSRPSKLTVPGLDKMPVYNNESIFHIDQLPARLVVVGGGPVGIEIAQAFQRLGSEVSIVHAGERLLEHDDRELVDVLTVAFTASGIRILLNSTITEVADSNTVTVSKKDGTTLSLQADALFVAIGRTPDLNPLDLVKAGIQVQHDKIRVNLYLQTSNRNIYVCGDIAGSLQFSHAAEQHARILLNNFFSPLKKKLNNDKMSWVTFSDPEVATFGLSERELIRRAIPYERLVHDFSEDDRAVTDGQQDGKIILLISQKRFLRKQRILGGGMVSAHAGELIQELILASNLKLSIDVLFNKIYPYPVASRVNQAIINRYKQQQLTGFFVRTLRWIYRFK